jgi:hypothetical protein
LLKSPPSSIDSAAFAHVLIRTRFQIKKMARLKGCARVPAAVGLLADLREDREAGF